MAAEVAVVALAGVERRASSSEVLAVAAEETLQAWAAWSKPQSRVGMR